MFCGILLRCGECLCDAEFVRFWEVLPSRVRRALIVPRWHIRVDIHTQHGGVHGDVHDGPLLRRGLSGTCRLPSGHVWFDDGAADGRVLRGMHCGVLLSCGIEQCNADGVWIWKRLSGRGGCLYPLYMHRGLCVVVDDDGRVRGQRGHLLCMWCGVQLHGGWSTSGVVLMLCGVCVDRHDLQRLRHDVCHLPVFRLQRGTCVRGRVGAAGCLHVHRWLRIYIDDNNRVCG